MDKNDSGPLDWSELFTPVRGVSAVFRVGPGADKFIVETLRKQEVPSATTGTLFSTEVTAWTLLDGGVHLVRGYGGGLDAGVRIFGWRTLRYIVDLLRLGPPTDALAGEETVPTVEELHAAMQAPDESWRERAILLSGVSDPASMRGFVQRVFGDRGLSGTRRPDYPATGVWGQLGFTVSAAVLLDGRLNPHEAARVAESHATHFPRGVNPLWDQMSLHVELLGYDRTIAEAVLRELDGERTPAPTEASLSDISTAEASAAAVAAADDAADGGEPAPSEPTLAQSLVEESQEDDDFDRDKIAGTTLVSLWWDNDTGMPNWCGGIDLVLLADGSAVMVHKGDSEGGVEPVDLPADDAARASAIASWLADDYHSGFAALDLEPLDPSDTLSDEARAEWQRAISQSNSHTRVSVGAIEPLVREALGNDSIYTRVRDALADPTSDEGQLLLTAIRATGDGGNYLYLESGEWEDLAL